VGSVPPHTITSEKVRAIEIRRVISYDSTDIDTTYFQLNFAEF
jgi:hypothetical protein